MFSFSLLYPRTRVSLRTMGSPMYEDYWLFSGTRDSWLNWVWVKLNYFDIYAAEDSGIPYRKKKKKKNNRCNHGRSLRFVEFSSSSHSWYWYWPRVRWTGTLWKAGIIGEARHMVCGIIPFSTPIVPFIVIVEGKKRTDFCRYGWSKLKGKIFSVSSEMYDTRSYEFSQWYFSQDNDRYKIISPTLYIYTSRYEL